MTIVVKIGGARAVNPEPAAADVATLVDQGEAVVIVHGGSTAVDDLLEELDREPEYVTTPDGVTGRFTDEDTMAVVTMAMAGTVNNTVTLALRTAGVDAVGLSGIDGGLLTGPRKSAVRVLEDGKKKIRRGDHAGRIESVNVDLLELLLGGGYTPAISLPMLADDGVAVNSDADRAAAAVAGALGAELILLTDVSGIYADPEDPTTRIDRVEDAATLESVREAAEGFMTRKLMAAEEALEQGSPTVVIGDGTVNAPISTARDGDATIIEAAALSGGTAT